MTLHTAAMDTTVKTLTKGLTAALTGLVLATLPSSAQAQQPQHPLNENELDGSSTVSATAQASMTPLRSRSASTARAWSSKRFVYKADGKRIVDVLNDFAANQNLPAIMGDGIEGLVQAQFNSSPDEFLAAMGRAYGVLWYHDGSALYFYPAKAIQSRLFRLKGFSKAQVESLLDSLQIGDKRYPLRFSVLESTLLVYGPPRHVDLVAAALESLDAGAIERNRRVVRVYPLRFASAGDRQMGGSTLPGMVSTLRALYGGASEGNKAAVPSNSAPSVPKVRAMASMFGAPQGEAERRQAEAAAANPAEKSTMGIAARGLRSPVNDEDDDNPVFQADDATNAVIVRGRVDRMADYFSVMRRLDIQPALIEIEAMIIDVSSDSINTLGIAWSARGQHANVSVASPSTSAAPTSGGSGTYSISTLWANAGRELLARIDALEAQGKARVVAKPKVLGVANRAAVMKENRIANIRVASNLDANLFRIEAGTQMHVTPQITTWGDVSRIRLSLYITDGNFEESAVDGVPVIKHTEIITGAHVTEGESLLIGGITVDSESTQTNGVPGLSRAPVVGGLFRWKSQKAKHSERLFLITPRLIRDSTKLPEASATNAPATAAVPLPPVSPAPRHPEPQAPDFKEDTP